MEQKLIESALQLTGKTMEDMDHICMVDDFSIEKFSYYLLSPEFIEKYLDTVYQYAKITKPERMKLIARWYGDAIYEYQRRDEEYPEGNETPLIELLSKIHVKN